MSDAADLQKEILTAISYINGAVANIRLYSPEHPLVSRHLAHAHAALTHMLRVRSEMTFIIVDDDLVVDHQPLATHTPPVTQLIQHLSRCAVERISFRTGISVEELTQLAGDLAASDQTTVRSTAAIKLGKVQLRNQDLLAANSLVAPEMQEQIEKLGVIRDQSLDRLRELYERIRVFKKTTVTGFEEIVQAFIKGMVGNVHPLQVLAALKAADEYTFTHAINVCILTMAQAEALGIGGRQLYDIGIAASLHDAGKVFVPDEILNCGYVRCHAQPASLPGTQAR